LLCDDSIYDFISGTTFALRISLIEYYTAKPYKTKYRYLMNAPSISLIQFDKSPYISSVHLRHGEKAVKSRSKISYTNEAIITGLKAQNVEIIKYIYEKFFQQIRFLIRSNSGTEMDAEDIFQDALVVIYQKKSTENIELTCSFGTYLYSICRHLWLQRLRKREFSHECREIIDLDEHQDNHDIDEILDDNEKYKLFQLHFLKLSAMDQKVLKLFMSKISSKEIASIMGYKSDKYAKFRKYICKEKLKNSILNDPQYQKIF
jgi:RNA polymerase sigma factor (sigma-70 family)